MGAWHLLGGPPPRHQSILLHALSQHCARRGEFPFFLNLYKHSNLAIFTVRGAIGSISCGPRLGTYSPERQNIWPFIEYGTIHNKRTREAAVFSLWRHLG